MVWLSGLSAGLRTRRSPVWFPVGAYAWLWPRSLVGDTQESTTHWCFCVSLSPSLHLFLKTNKIRKKEKRAAGKRSTWKAVHRCLSSHWAPICCSCLCFWLLWSRNLNNDQRTSCVKFADSRVASRVFYPWHWLKPLKVLVTFFIVSWKPWNSWWFWDVPDAKLWMEGSFRIVSVCVLRSDAERGSHLPQWFRGTVCSSGEKVVPPTPPWRWPVRQDVCSWIHNPTEKWKYYWYLCLPWRATTVPNCVYRVGQKRFAVVSMRNTRVYSSIIDYYCIYFP